MSPSGSTGGAATIGISVTLPTVGSWLSAGFHFRDCQPVSRHWHVAWPDFADCYREGRPYSGMSPRFCRGSQTQAR